MGFSGASLQLIDRLDSQNGRDQTKFNAFFTVLPSRGRLSADSEGPSNQQVIDYIREDLERARSEVLRHFNISRKRAKRLVASARSQLTDRDIVNFLRPREDWSKGAVLKKLRITESRYARCVAELRAATPVDRSCVLRFLRAGNRRRRKKDAWPGSTSALLSLIRLVLGWPGRLGWGGFCVYVESSVYTCETCSFHTRFGSSCAFVQPTYC